MKRVGIILTLLALVVIAASQTWAFTCPVVIKQAEDLIKKAESGKVTADTKPLIDEAKKQLAEARAHHDHAKTKRDHGDAVRKAKIAAAFAEEAIVLQGP
jgi:type IV secretory pathway VirB6-like protein